MSTPEKSQNSLMGALGHPDMTDSKPQIEFVSSGRETVTKVFDLVCDRDIASPIDREAANQSFHYVDVRIADLLEKVIPQSENPNHIGKFGLIITGMYRHDLPLIRTNPDLILKLMGRVVELIIRNACRSGPANLALGRSALDVIITAQLPVFSKHLQADRGGLLNGNGCRRAHSQRGMVDEIKELCCHLGGKFKFDDGNGKIAIHLPINASIVPSQIEKPHFRCVHA